MTAQLVDFPDHARRAEDTIRATVRGIIKGRGIPVEIVAPRVGMSPSTLYRKLSGHGVRDGFKAGEVAALAQTLGVKVQDLYDGLGGTFTPPDENLTVSCLSSTRRHLRLVS